MLPFPDLRAAAFATLVLASPLPAAGGPPLSEEDFRALEIAGWVAAHAENCGRASAVAAIDRLFEGYAAYSLQRDAAALELAGGSDAATCARIDRRLPELLLWGRGWRNLRARKGDAAPPR